MITHNSFPALRFGPASSANPAKPIKSSTVPKLSTLTTTNILMHESPFCFTRNAQMDLQGDIAHGGYSTAIRAHERFTFPIPKELDSKMAAPLMCAGITVYSPLKANNVGKGKVVGIVGIGGLGRVSFNHLNFMVLTLATAISLFNSLRQWVPK